MTTPQASSVWWHKPHWLEGCCFLGVDLIQINQAWPLVNCHGISQKSSKKVTSHLRWVYYSMFIQTIGEEECDLLLKQSKNNKKSFALAETRTRIARVAGEHSTLRPPVLLFIKLFLFIYNTASRHNLCCSLEACTHKIVWLTHSLSLFAFFQPLLWPISLFFSLKQTMFYKLYH